ncbi:phosphonoacetaldehyde reductase [Alteromonas lipotrueae]|uniref:phosphonoacetaldehyde reductase n=1 Tax=Alteromonas lipotrueae TaxID=2803814 RepID=UPI001C459064|nr:phosphonoacetaldehyde reductase [Alteromonas lipotrueae]
MANDMSFMPPMLTKALNERLIQSDDYLSSVSKLIEANHEVLLVTSQGFVKRGVVDAFKAKLKCERFHVIDDVTPNPELTYIDGLYARFKTSKVTHIIALGGGSVLDTSKVLRVMLQTQSGGLHQLMAARKAVSNSVALIAIPTTSGTGAEITPFATVWDTGDKKKYSIDHAESDKVVLDPNLTVGLPPYETMVTALDALSHAIESLWNVRRSNTSERYAVQAIALICEHLRPVLKKPKNIEGRAALQFAAFLSGLAISETKTALAHAISYPLTIEFKVPHGLACSFTLAAMLKVVGANRLKLSQDMVDRIINLLDALRLNDEMKKFAELPQMLKAVDRELDPSRAGNFTTAVTPDLVKAIIKESLS